MKNIFGVRLASRSCLTVVSSFLTGLVLSLFLGATPAASQTVAEVVVRVQERHDLTRDFRARFIQESTSKLTNRVEREEGTVFFKNPQRMRWEYSRPKGKLLVINPQRTWLYLPDDRLVYVQETDKMLQSRLAVRFFTGTGRLEDDFTVAFATPHKTDRPGNHLLVLTPREPSPEIERVTLTVDRKTYSIIQFILVDFAGNTNRIELNNLVINSKLPEKLFQFRIPEGVETITLP